MKKIYYTVAIILVSVTLSSCGLSRTAINSPDAKEKNITNTFDQNDNYIKANEWMVQTFNNAKSVIQFSDKEAGIVKGKYIMKTGTISTNAYAASIPDFSATITIRVKDNAARIEILAPDGMFSQKAYGVQYGFTAEMFNNSADALISDFEKNMKSESANKDW